MDSTAALDSLFRDALDAINAPIDTSYLDILDTPSDTSPPDAPLDAQTSDVPGALYDPLDALIFDSLNETNTPLDASALGTLNVLNAPFDTSYLDFLDNIGGSVDETNRNDLVQEPSNLPVPLSLDEGSVSTLQGANVPTSFDLLLASILDSSLSPYGQDVQNPPPQDIRASTVNAATSTQLHYSVSTAITSPLTLTTDGSSSGLDFGLGMNNHSGLRMGDSGNTTQQQQMDQNHSSQIIAASTSRRSKVSSRKAPRFQFKKAKINVAGVRGPEGLEIFFGIMDGEEAAEKPFTETRAKVYNHVLRNSTLIGIFDFAWTSEGYLRCQGDCKLTATGWEIFPQGLCNEEFSVEHRYVAHLKSHHLYDFGPGGQAYITGWIRRRMESLQIEQSAASQSEI